MGSDPGVALAQFVPRIKANESNGYQYIFYPMIFFSEDCIVGLAWRNVTARAIARSFLVVLGVLLPSLLSEIVLAHWRGQVVSLGNIALLVFIALAGSLWINADGGKPNGSMHSSTPSRERS